MTFRLGPGWGTSPFGSGPWGGPVLGGVPPANATFDQFCIGPCGDMVDIGLYLMTTLSGSYSLPPLYDYLLLESSNEVESSLFLDNAVPDSYTLEYTLEFDSLPPNNSFPNTYRIFVGAFEDSGASTGLLFSASGIAFGTVLGEMFTPLPDGHKYIWEGEKFVIRVAVSLTNDVVFVYITPQSELSMVQGQGQGHKLRYVLTVPGTTAALSEGITISVLGTGANPVQVRVSQVCLGTGLAIPNRPPTADAGSYQEMLLCTFGRLDGSASFDPEGASLTYFWRLIDAPATSAAVFEGQGGFTVAGVGGFCDKFYSSELQTAHADTPIVANDVLLLGAEPYTIVTTGVDGDGFFAQISTFALPELTTGIPFKLIRQAPILTTPTSQKPSIYVDTSGVFKFGLIVYDGDLYSEEATVAINVRESVVPRGVCPDLSFVWGYLGDFWSIVENRDPITAVWDALAQITAAQLLTLWQVDYNKSLRDIQRTFQRRWLYYDLMLQEPFIELTTVGYFDTATGYLSGATGSTTAVSVYSITDDLSTYDIAIGDFLLLDGEAYRIRTYLPGAPGVPNAVQTDLPLPAGVSDWMIVRPTKSTQIDFYLGLVVEDDHVVYEIRQIDTGQVLHVQATVLATSSEEHDKLLVDLTSVMAYLTDDAYQVCLLGVFRRKYSPVNERIVAIPYLQATVPTAEEEQILYHNVDYFLETFRGLPCLRFDPEVWQHDSGGALVADATPPARLWAEVTYLENLSAVEANFGKVVDFTQAELAQTTSDTDYLSAVQGLWYIYLGGPTLYNLRVGMQILLGLPFAEQKGTIESLNEETVSGITRMYVRDTDGAVSRMYRFSAGVDVETNPETSAAYVVGDTVEKFAPLATGVTVDDYVSDPDWFRPWISAGAMTEPEKYFRFVVRVSSLVYKLDAMPVARRHLLMFKPTYTYPVLVVSHELDPQDIDVTDLMSANVTLNLWEGACYYNTFGVATMWDQPDPAPVKMSSPPDGGTPTYVHERLPGVFSGWRSAYDEPIHVGWYGEQAFTDASIVGPLPPGGVALAPDPYTSGYDTGFVHVSLYLEFDEANPDELNKNYELVIYVNAVEQKSIPFTITWINAGGGLHFYARGFPIAPYVTATAGDAIQVVIRPGVGSDNTPSWKNVEVNTWIAFGYTSPDVEWGHDEGTMCPEELCEATILCVWPGGLPAYDHPLFAFDCPIYPAAIVGDHIELTLAAPLMWAWDVPIPAGVYGRTFVL